MAEDVNNGITHKGSFFKLTKDIDFGGAEFKGIGCARSDYYCPFMGEFHGWFNGHTVSNFKLTGQGFFGLISEAEITGLRLSNFTITETAYSDYLYPWMGGLVGWEHFGDSRIAGCVVDGVTVNRNWTFGGILGCSSTSYGTNDRSGIETCLVKNINFYSGYSSTKGAFVGDLGNYKWLDVSGICSDSDLTSTCGIVGDSYTSLLDDGAYINKNWTESYGKWVYTMGGDQDSNWYFAPSYNDGVPMLRSFIKWKEYTITSSNSVLIDASYRDSEVSAVSSDWNKNGKNAEDYGTIWLPEEADEKIKTSGTTISCDGYYLNIVAEKGEDVSSDYVFSGWTRSSDTFTGQWVANTVREYVVFIHYHYSDKPNYSASAPTKSVTSGSYVRCNIEYYGESDKIKSVLLRWSVGGKILLSIDTEEGKYYISSITGIDVGSTMVIRDIYVDIYYAVKTYSPGGVEPAQ